MNNEGNKKLSQKEILDLLAVLSSILMTTGLLMFVFIIILYNINIDFYFSRRGAIFRILSDLSFPAGIILALTVLYKEKNRIVLIGVITAIALKMLLIFLLLF